MAYTPRSDVGLMQFVILKLIQRDSQNAYVAGIKDKLSRYRDLTEIWVGVALYRLEQRGLIACVGQKEGVGYSKGHLLNLYALTKSGEDTLMNADSLLRVLD